MKDIHCPKDIGFENTFSGEDCAKEQYYNNCYHCWSTALAKEKALEQEPKTGHWIELDECSNSGYYCSKCHKKVVKEGWSDTVKKIKYCPNCGAKMIEPQKSEE